MSTLVSALFGRSLVAVALLLTPPSWTLDWSAPAGCPAEAEVQAALGAALGPAVEVSETLEIDGRMGEGGAGGLRLDITFRGALAGERTLRGRDCRELTDAAVLVIAIAVQREERAEPQTPQDSSSHPEGPSDAGHPGEVPPGPGAGELTRGIDGRAAEVGSETPRGVEAPPGEVRPGSTEPLAMIEEEPLGGPPAPGPPGSGSRSRPPMSGFLRAGGGVSVGHLPPVAAVMGIEGGIDMGRSGRAWRVSLGLSGSPPREVSGATNPAVGAAVSLWSLRPDLCHLPGTRGWAFPVCLGVELGAMRARGTGALVRPETASSFWSAGRLSAGVLWRRGNFGLWLALSGTAALTRPAFRTLQTPLVFRAGGFGGHVTAGVELRLPQRSRG